MNTSNLICDHSLENMKSVSSANIGEHDCVWVGWFTPYGTTNTRMVGLTSLPNDKPHNMTEDECHYIQAQAGYDHNGYATVWAEMIK